MPCQGHIRFRHAIQPTNWHAVRVVTQRASKPGLPGRPLCPWCSGATLFEFFGSRRSVSESCRRPSWQLHLHVDLEMLMRKEELKKLIRMVTQSMNMPRCCAENILLCHLRKKHGPSRDLCRALQQQLMGSQRH